MNTLLYNLKNWKKALSNPDAESLNFSLNDVHSKGLFSLVISGTEAGKLTRAFIATKKLKPYNVQLHTHRYSIRLTVLKGIVTHYTAVKAEKSHQTLNLPLFEYKSALNGGFGLKKFGSEEVMIHESILPVGSVVEMSASDFHTVSCSKDAIWMVEELGFETMVSYVLGVPFVVEHLYNKPEMFQVNDKAQELLIRINELINSFENIG